MRSTVEMLLFPDLLYLLLYVVKVKLSLCLTKHHAVKTYWGVEV
jgi:hypothetical protein